MPPRKETTEHYEPFRCSCNFSADEVAEALVRKLADQETASMIMDTWGAKLDQQLGRGLRRFGLYVVFALLGAGAIKLNLLESLIKMLK